MIGNFLFLNKVNFRLLEVLSGTWGHWPHCTWFADEFYSNKVTIRACIDTVSFQPYVRHMLRVTQTFWQVWCLMLNVLHYTLCSCPMGRRPEFFLYIYSLNIYNFRLCYGQLHVWPLALRIIFLKIAMSESFCYHYVDMRSKRYSNLDQIPFDLADTTCLIFRHAQSYASLQFCLFLLLQLLHGPILLILGEAFTYCIQSTTFVPKN